MTRLIVGPFNRVEGDLEVRLTTDNGTVTEAQVVSPLYRGFERMLAGKEPMDALVYAPRICGICSVSQSVAAARALGAAMGLSMPENGERAVNLIHACENIADHLTHFYLFFMPDFARPVYAGEPWHADMAERFVAIRGTASEEVLPARAQFLHVMGILAGKWPHTLSIQPGGSTRAVAAGERARLVSILVAFRRFLERTLFGAPLERIASLENLSDLETYLEEGRMESADFRRFLKVSRALELDRLGLSHGGFLSYGAYAASDGQRFRRGTFGPEGGGLFDPADVTEDLSHAWYRAQAGRQAPFEGSTEPDAEREEAYSWCKAPRLNGRVAEVGAYARQLVDGHPLVHDLRRHSPGSVHSRVVARLLEIALTVLAMEEWAGALEPGGRYINHGVLPKDGEGIGLTEAARGSLGHWLTIRKGRIANYQIIAPTTWNFSPRDAAGAPGPLEQALAGAPVREGETNPVAVQHIVRSFDPCMVCTVH